MSDLEATLRSGTLLCHGMYRVERVIGRGGFGITYLAVNTTIDTPVAIKEFFPKGMLNRNEYTDEASYASKDTGELTDKLKTKFVKEARRIAALNHESIVRVTAAFEENGTAYYVMDFIEGRDMHSLVRNEGPLPVDRAVGYVTQVGKALEYLHSLRINHLDVKPANILIDPKTDKAVLIDFGLSKQYDNGGHQTSTTPVGVSEGYAPIEQYKAGGVQEFSATTDVYALAATLYYLLTGQRPPSANDLVEDDLRFPSNVPGYLQTAISRAMSTRRADRYPTVAAFLAAMTPNVATKNPMVTQFPDVTTKLSIENKKLDRYYSGAVEVKIDTPKYKPRRNWFKPILLGVILIATIGVLIVGFYKRNSEVDNTIPNSKDKSKKDFEAVQYQSMKIQPGDSVAMAKYYEDLKKVADDGNYAANQNAKLLYASYLYTDKEDYDGALAYLDKVSPKSKTEATGVAALKGDCYVELKQYDKGIECYEVALVEADDDPEVTPYLMNKIANVYFVDGKFDKQLEILEKLREEYPSYKAYAIESEIARAKALAKK